MTLPQAVQPGQIAANARCASCGSPLVPDQLFCLSCGTRRRDARIAFRDVLATEAAPVVAPPAGGGGWPPAGGALPAGAQPGPVGPQRISYMPFIATLALLLVALGVGVLIGRKPAQTAAAPTYVPTAAVAATTPVTTTPTDAAAAADDTKSKKSDSSKSDSSAVDDSAKTVKDDTSELNKLDKLSPEEYQKQSQKLPTEVGTGGKAPPKDNKPAGGGSETETFN